MFTLNCNGRLFSSQSPVVMGIINATPDSFYSHSRIGVEQEALEKTAQMIQEGAQIIDLGAQSTRPGSDAIGAEEEIRRLSPLLAAIRKEFPQTYISVDTYHAAVARWVAGLGADMINDIGGGNFDSDMMPTVSALKLPYICMHIAGNAKTMHQRHDYDKDILLHLIDHFTERIATARQLGIQDIVIDPGFGFSKTMAENFRLIAGLSALQVLQCPILVGLSRKSTIYKTLGITPEEALNGSTVLHTAALLNGAQILRVHDVREAMEAITLTEALKSANLHSSL